MTEEQKAYDLAVDNHERAMARAAELEREVAALKQGQEILILARDEQKRLANEYRELWAKAAEARAALAQSERVPEWIPVSERLPDHGEPVNVWCSGSDQAGVAWVRQGAWYMPEPQALGYESITHWMPLPAAPSPSKQGGV